MAILTSLSTFPWIGIHALACFLLSVGIFAEQIPYSDHCSSFVPEAVPDINSNSLDTFPITQNNHGYYSGNFSNILDSPGQSPSRSRANYSSGSSNDFLFQTRDVQGTDRKGVLKVEADLMFRFSNYDGFYVVDSSPGTTYFPSFFRGSSRRKRTRTWVQFRLEGFWSDSSGKLCMVGSSFSRERDGLSDLNLKAVLKMENVESSANITGLFTGTLESLSSGDRNFGAVSVLMFPQGNSYKYSQVTEETRTELPRGLSLGNGEFCSTFQMYGYRIELKYAAHCDDPSKNCNPLGVAKPRNSDSLPSIMSWRVLNCLEGDRKVRFLLNLAKDWNYRYYGSFNPDVALVGEGRWVESKNQLQILACRIHTDGRRSFSSARVEDCSIELSFSFPETWSIKERSSMLGEIRSKKRTNESGYFAPIAIKDTVNTYGSGLVGLKYKYTEAERLKRLCPAKKHDVESKKYPDRFSRDLNFDMSVKTPRGKMLKSGYSYPLFIGNKPYGRFSYGMRASETSSSDSVMTTKSGVTSRFSIAYQMSLTDHTVNGSSSGSSERMSISAEGVYDTDTGGLCMVGCWSRNNSNPESADCEILISFQFPPVDSKKAKETIRGSISSTRKRLDPLYFDRLNVSASAFYVEQSTRSIWRLDLEISLVLISNTMSCVFVVLQILYVRKHPQVLPMASLVMLTILALGPAIPLVLNFEALFLESRNRQQSYYLESGMWLEANEVLVRVATLVACLLHFRLLQLSFSLRRGEGGHEKPCAAEKKSLLVSLPLYAIGAFATLLVNWRTNPENSMWGILKCYAGLVLDGFLLPQVLLNVFRGSTEKALSVPYYVGMTLVRLVPHGYDLWRARNLVQTRFDDSYIYGKPEADFYSTAWDVIIPLGGITLATVIYLQQLFGGCCIVPQRFRKSSINYEKVPVVSDA